MESFLSKSPEETKNIAGSFAASLHRNEIIALIGDLGSGKTQFVKGVCRYFQVHDLVSSPTFVMLHRYAGRDLQDNELLVYHFDLYRIKAPREILELGYEEFFHDNGICLIEWADLLGDLTPRDRTEVKFFLGSKENERRIEITKCSEEQNVSGTPRLEYSALNEHPRH